MTEKVKPSIYEVHALLREKKALIVHFSTEGKGREWNQIIQGLTDLERQAAIEKNISRFYPGDLLYAINRTEQSLCASTISANDDPLLHAMGCIGLILGIQRPASLRAVYAGDDGYLGEDDDRDMDIPIEVARDTIEYRHERGHNEWLVKDYRPLGILALPPFHHFDGRTGGLSITTLDAIRETFRGKVPVYGFHKGALYKLNDDGSADQVEIATLYP